jgi:hypothetical protein
MAAKKPTLKKQSGNSVASNSRTRGLKPFKPGQSGNPAGRPKGSRNKISEDFLDICSEVNQEHIRSVLLWLVKKDPATFARIVSGLVPKQVQVDGEQVVWVMSDRPISNDEWESKWAADDPPAQLGTPRRTTKRSR